MEMSQKEPDVTLMKEGAKMQHMRMNVQQEKTACAVHLNAGNGCFENENWQRFAGCVQSSTWDHCGQSHLPIFRNDP